MSFAKPSFKRNTFRVLMVFYWCKKEDKSDGRNQASCSVTYVPTNKEHINFPKRNHRKLFEEYDRMYKLIMCDHMLCLCNVYFFFDFIAKQEYVNN